MTLRTPRSSSIPSRYATRLAVALALSCTVSTSAYAFRLSHSRIVSAANAPLQVLVGIADLTPDEQRSLMASLADPAAWERAGVTPPVPLSSMTLQLEGGGGPTRRNLRISSPDAAKGPVVDLLLNFGTSAGQRQVQVSVMQTAGGFPGLTSQAQIGTRPQSARGSRDAVGVRSGDTLYGIAQSHAVPDATIYQMLVALWQANPRAFIQNNMNLVKAGTTLVIPDAATVRAVDPAEARRIYLEQQQAYARYRARLAGAAARGAAAAGAASSTAGQIGATSPGAAPEPSTQDRLRLSSGQSGQGDAQADARTSMDKATKDAQGRVDELERNVKDLNAALAAARTADQGQGAGAVAGNGQAAGGNGQAGGAPSGATSQNGASSLNGSQAGSNSTGSSGAQGRGATPGVSGDAATVGGATGQSGTPGSSASSAGGASSRTGGAGTGGAGVSPSGAGSASGGAGSASSTPGASSSGSAGATAGTGGSASFPGAGGSASGPGTPQAGAAAGAGGAANAGGDNRASGNANSPSIKQDTTSGQDGDAMSGLPSWLTDNLLIILTAVLALVAFVIAWLLRRAAARREEDQDDLEGELYMSEIDQGAIDRRLEGINLDLDEPPRDDDRRRTGPIRT